MAGEVDGRPRRVDGANLNGSHVLRHAWYCLFRPFPLRRRSKYIEFGKQFVKFWRRGGGVQGFGYEMKWRQSVHNAFKVVISRRSRDDSFISGLNFTQSGSSLSIPLPHLFLSLLFPVVNFRTATENWTRGRGDFTLMDPTGGRHFQSHTTYNNTSKKRWRGPRS